MADSASRFYRKVMFPILDRRRGTNSLARFAELRKNQWLKSHEMEALQHKKLRTLILHAYNNVPYYHELMDKLRLKPDDIKGPGDLGKLPIMDKSTVREHFERLKASNFESLRPVSRTTGGTTGKPMRYFSDRNEHSVFWADLWRAWTWAGYELGDRRATIGGSRPSSSGFSLGSFLRSRIMERNLSLSSFEVTPEAMQGHVGKLRKYKPKILRGYPSSLFLFARYLSQQQVSELGVKSVISISEQLYDHQRRAIESAFGCPLFDNYGCPDGGVVACQCDQQEYHINSDNVIFEIIGGGEAADPGHEGEIVTTNLERFAMPLIRYRTGDLAIGKEGESSCGRSLEMLTMISGRTADYILLPDGNLLAAVNIASVFNEISSQVHIRQYQVVQERKGEVTVLVVEDDGFLESEGEFIRNTLKEFMGGDMAIEVRTVEDIPLTEAGKMRSVVSKLEVNVV